MDISVLALNDRAYHYAYRASDDWMKEEPTWQDVQDAYKAGTKETLDAVKILVRKFGVKPSDFEKIRKQLLS